MEQETVVGMGCNVGHQKWDTEDACCVSFTCTQSKDPEGGHGCYETTAKIIPQTVGLGGVDVVVRFVGTKGVFVVEIVRDVSLSNEADAPCDYEQGASIGYISPSANVSLLSWTVGVVQESSHGSNNEIQHPERTEQVPGQKSHVVLVAIFIVQVRTVLISCCNIVVVVPLIILRCEPGYDKDDKVQYKECHEDNNKFLSLTAPLRKSVVHSREDHQALVVHGREPEVESHPPIHQIDGGDCRSSDVYCNSEEQTCPIGVWGSWSSFAE